MEVVGGGGGQGRPQGPGGHGCIFQLSLSAPCSPPAAFPPRSLAHPVHLKDHWIGTNGPPASPLLPLGTHLAPASHPPRGTQAGREAQGSREQNRSRKAIKKQVSGLEAGKWGAG